MFRWKLPCFDQGGQCLSGSFTFLILHDYEITVFDGPMKNKLRRLDDGYAYEIIGELKDSGLDSCGIKFEDETLTSEFAYLIGHSISLKVDRINVEFLKKAADF